MKILQMSESTPPRRYVWSLIEGEIAKLQYTANDAPVSVQAKIQGNATIDTPVISGRNVTLFVTASEGGGSAVLSLIVNLPEGVVKKAILLIKIDGAN